MTKLTWHDGAAHVLAGAECPRDTGAVPSPESLARAWPWLRPHMGCAGWLSQRGVGLPGRTRATGSRARAPVARAAGAGPPCRGRACLAAAGHAPRLGPGPRPRAHATGGPARTARGPRARAVAGAEPPVATRPRRAMRRGRPAVEAMGRARHAAKSAPAGVAPVAAGAGEPCARACAGGPAAPARRPCGAAPGSPWNRSHRAVAAEAGLAAAAAWPGWPVRVF